MKIRVITLSIIASLLVACGGQSKKTLGTTFESKAKRIQVMAPEGWTSNNSKKSPYDLQLLSANKELGSGFFVYSLSDFGRPVTGMEILTLQVNDMKSKREQFTPLEALRTEQFGEKVVTSITFSGLKNKVKNHYRFAMVRYPSHPEIMVVVLQTSTPKQWTTKRRSLEDIVLSTELLDAAKVKPVEAVEPVKSVDEAKPAEVKTNIPETSKDTVTKPTTAP
tara:strand:+ start:1449 stop:2114 length:666 start_codon:yes stop_codon:yes gene_type:complete